MRQREFFGFESIHHLQEILDEQRSTSIFLVTGKESYHKSGVRAILHPLLQGYRVVSFTGSSSLPLVEDLERGINIFRKENCDLTIAVGGGSVIDIAKLVNILSAQEEVAGKDDDDANGSIRHPRRLIDYIEKNKEIKKRGRPLVTIPTTAGSGSEATHFAVTYVGNKKFSVAHEYILPEYSIVDPNLMMTLPPRITATSGMDALCQAIESYWSVHSTDQSKEFSKEAIRLILRSLREAVTRPTSQPRLEMANAANLAGKAINITKTTAPHAVSYPISAYYGVPHGHAVALTLAEFLSYNGDVDRHTVNPLTDLNRIKLNISELLDILDVPDVDSAKKLLLDLMSSIGLETRLSELGIDDKGIETILSNANLERLSNNPRMVTEKALRRIFINIK